MKNILPYWFLAAASLVSIPAWSAPLSLADYLEQVSSASPSVAAARLHTEGGYLRAGGAEVLTFPYLFGNLNTLDDRAETALPAFMGTQTNANVYSLGVGVNSPYGLNGKYTWNQGYTNTQGTPFATSNNYTAYNRLDLTMNLAHNGFGSEIRARKELALAGNTAQALAGKFQLVARLSEAESTYWRLVFAREAVLVEKDILSRADRLLGWAHRRVGLELGDRGDLLQAQASSSLHRLELSNALEEERNAARAFNVLRNKNDEAVPENVAAPSFEETLRISAPARDQERLDVQAAAERTKSAQAQSQLEKELLKPNVDVVASYAWNGRGDARGNALSRSFGNAHPTKAIGVNFTVPLDVPTWTRAVKGANDEITAADLELEQTRLNEAKDWNDLQHRLTEARSRLALLEELEKVQKEKFENEHRRLQRGRTTTFQTLSFEQDYAQAQLLRLRTQADVLQTLAQMKSFRGTP